MLSVSLSLSTTKYWATMPTIESNDYHCFTLGAPVAQLSGRRRFTP